jgi:hypothetical protein
MAEKNYKVEIKGVSPLLQNRFAGEETIGKTKKKSETSRENDVEDTMYKLPSGELYQPSDCIKQTLIEAGKAFKQGKSNKSKTFASFVIITPEAIIHKNQKWTTDRRAVVIPSTKGRVMRNRCRFEEWSLGFNVQVLDDAEIDEKLLHDALEYSGHYIGIGDYRPQKKGMYGRFIVSSIKEVK